jgi:hypothetical protein
VIYWPEIIWFPDTVNAAPESCFEGIFGIFFILRLAREKLEGACGIRPLLAGICIERGMQIWLPPA